MDTDTIAPDEYREKVTDFQNQIAKLQNRKGNLDTMKLLELNRKKELIEYLKASKKELETDDSFLPRGKFWVDWDIHYSSPEKDNESIRQTLERDPELADTIIELRDKKYPTPRQMLERYGFKIIVHEDLSVIIKGSIPTEKSLDTLVLDKGSGCW
ncbi:MAG: hypothetical protein JSU79_08340 [Dehalococcoidales bacterium]|nr:MAG: hypothetical protein JSU79_08340 [Dehalococcoidales bacterium]